MSKSKKTTGKFIAENRKARYEYEILETFEAGISLLGSEVKSLRQGTAAIAESYATIEGGEAVLINAYIAPYDEANRFNHEPRRKRKLLLHKREIHRLFKGIKREGMTIIALRLYFNARGRAKLALALGKGKKLHDKRETEKRKTWARDKARLLRNS